MGVWTKVSKEARMPHVIIILLIHFLGPTFAIIALPGTSKRKYPRKKIPAPNPKIAFEKPKSLFICRAAYPIFTLSSTDIEKHRNRNGINLNVTFLVVERSSAS